MHEFLVLQYSSLKTFLMEKWSKNSVWPAFRLLCYTVAVLFRFFSCGILFFQSWRHLCRNSAVCFNSCTGNASSSKLTGLCVLTSFFSCLFTLYLLFLCIPILLSVPFLLSTSTYTKAYLPKTEFVKHFLGKKVNSNREKKYFDKQI